jgi:hypothetical protein
MQHLRTQPFSIQSCCWGSSNFFLLFCIADRCWFPRLVVLVGYEKQPTAVPSEMPVQDSPSAHRALSSGQKGTGRKRTGDRCVQIECRKLFAFSAPHFAICTPLVDAVIVGHISPCNKIILNCCIIFIYSFIEFSSVPKPSFGGSSPVRTRQLNGWLAELNGHHSLHLSTTCQPSLCPLEKTGIILYLIYVR